MTKPIFKFTNMTTALYFHVIKKTEDIEWPKTMMVRLLFRITNL